MFIHEDGDGETKNVLTIHYNWDLSSFQNSKSSILLLGVGEISSQSDI